jgi:Protein of unknown function (DUF3991)/Toprim-like
MNFEQRRHWIDGLRRIPLEAVLRTANAQPDDRDHAQWRTAQGVLSVNGAKFINWNQGRGGGGAIDLAMHLKACDFTAAVQWLAQRFPSPQAPALAPPPKPPLALPTPDASRLPGVKRYLIEQRRLPDNLLEPLVLAGRLYADPKANAVFLLLGKENQPVGAELRGTTGTAWRGLAPGSHKDLGYFSVGPAQSQEAVLCESAIDALSCTALHPDRLCLSTAGARPNPAWLRPLLNQGLRLYCGFDADPTGDHMAAVMIAQHPAIHRLRPPLHDWNDVLIASA